MTAPKLRFGLLVAILVVLALPAAASAAPVLVHDATTVTESAPRDGVVTGGDAITILERIRNTGGAPLTNLTATLTSSTSGVTVDSAASAYPDLAGFGTGTNTVAFEVHLPSVLPCGTVVQFSLAVSATDANSGDPVAENVAFGVRTGYLGSPTTGYDRGRSTDIPNGTASLRSFSGLAALGGPGSGTSTITVPSADTGTVAAVSVRLGHLHYPLGHIRISLRAPNGRQIVLLDHRGGSATDLDNTTFAVGGADPATVSDFTGATVRPEESFDALLGSARNGNWKLVFAVDDSTELGTLADWHLDLTPADCAPRAFASLTASPSQVAPGGDVTIDASGTVVDAPATYAYTGDYTTITGGSTSQAHVTFNTRGLHHVTVDVTDAHGAHFSAGADVIVSNLPTADLQPGSATVLTGDPVAFDAGASSDPDPGGIVGYEWSIDGGAFQTGPAQRSISFATPGTHGVTVRVTDADGATDEASAVVSANNRPPAAALAVASPPAVTGRTTTLDAGGSTDDGTIVDYQWDLDGNGTFEVDGGTSKTRTVVFGTHGPHVVNVRAVDDYGDHGDAQLTVDVTDAPVAGTIDATPTQPRPGASVTLTVNGASDDDGTIDHYQWDFGDGTSDTTAALSTTHAWAIAATRTITVRVFDDDGASSTTSRSLAIGGIPPVATLTANPNPVVEGGSVHFDASGSHDADSPIAGYRWDLDDDGIFERNTGTTQSVDATYPVAGTLTVRVRVTDVDGNTNVASVALTVAAAPGTAPPSGGGGSSPDGSGTGGAGGGGGGDAGGSGGGASGGGGRGFVASLAGDAIQRRDEVLKSGLQVSCRTNRVAICALRVELSGRDARRLGLAKSARKPVVIGRATVRSDGAKPGTAKLRLSRAAAAKLRRMARVTVTVTGQATTASGEKATLTRSVLVRRR